MAQATTAASTRWAWLREQTPTLREMVYLNAGFQGPMSESVAAAMREWLDRELREGPTSRPLLAARRELGQRYREAVAKAIGADADEIAITDNTTHGLNMVTAGLRVEPGEHEIELYLDGYRTVKQKVYLTQDNTFRIKYQMERLGHSVGHRDAKAKVALVGSPAARHVLGCQFKRAFKNRKRGGLDVQRRSAGAGNFRSVTRQTESRHIGARADHAGRELHDGLGGVSIERAHRPNRAFELGGR